MPQGWIFTLPLTGNPVPVKIPPYLELREDAIAGVDLSVGVIVQVCKYLKPIHCTLPVLQKGLVAEKLLPIVYDPISVNIPDENTVVCRHPARLFGKTISIMVEESTIRNKGGFHAITIQIQHDRVSHTKTSSEGLGGLGGDEQRTQFIRNFSRNFPR